LDYRKHEGCSEPEPVLPDGSPEIVLNLADKFIRIDSEREEIQPATIVAGQMTRRILIRPSGHVSLFGVRFTPAGASQFFKFPLYEITDQIVELSAAVGTSGRELEEKIGEACSFGERVATFEELLLDRLAERGDLDNVAWAASELIIRERGRLSVASVTKKVRVSDRQLGRRFQVSIGVSPKTFSKIIRFQSAVRAFQDGTSPNLLDAALAFGYYDQSHLIRDFKAFSGTTPLAYFEHTHNISDMFTGAA
jgi:AraC-like DNA-binding protein